MQASVFIATSLDGYIARKDGNIDWLIAASNPEDPEDYGYKAFSDTVDCMVMGRGTMEIALSFEAWPYEGKRVIVLSNTLTEVPAELMGKIELYSGSLVALAEKLQTEGCQRLYIDGGKTIQSFLNENLITDMIITQIPILIGEGLPLFGKTNRDIQLKHISTQSFPIGFVQSTYEVVSE